jgi:hypothetical protein
MAMPFSAEYGRIIGAGVSQRKPANRRMALCRKFKGLSAIPVFFREPPC